jgi:hypothetical protein
MTIRAILRSNTVLLVASNESRAELADLLRGDNAYNRAEGYVAEQLHEKWEFVRPEEVGALTDSPLLAECDGIVRDDEGELTDVGKVAWFPDYAVRDPWEELRNRGRTVFTLSPEDCAA